MFFFLQITLHATLSPRTFFSLLPTQSQSLYWLYSPFRSLLPMPPANHTVFLPPTRLSFSITRIFYMSLCFIQISNFFFYLMFFSVPRSHLRHHITGGCHLSLGSSGLWQCLGCFLLFMTLTVLRLPVSYFVNHSLPWVCLMFSSWLEWGDGFRGGV